MGVFQLKYIVGFSLAILINGVVFAEVQSIEKQNDSTPTPLSVEDVQRFSTAISHIKRYYVKSVDDKKLFENAIRGMVSGLDPHSAYLDEEEYADLQTTTKGEFGGLGIEVTVDSGFIKVVTPIDDTPAKNAGIKSGDYIIRLDNKSVKNMTLQDAVNTMRGKKGTNIELTVLRKGQTEPLRFKLTRDIIHIQSVKGRLLDQKYAYIRVSHFQEPTASDFQKMVEKLSQEAGGQLKGLILDLRNNPGGLLDSAIQISDLLIPDGEKGQKELIVYTEGRIPGSKFRAYATPGDILKGAPIVVLINEGSASGAEIVAGALKDQKRALLMGTKTFGKGSVQTVLPLDGKRGLKITTALYYTPSGRSIQAEGVTPNIVVDDIKIPKPKKSLLENLSESSLKNHLENGNGKETIGDSAAAKVDVAASAYEDYQLHEALNLLKAMVIMQQEKEATLKTSEKLQ